MPLLFTIIAVSVVSVWALLMLVPMVWSLLFARAEARRRRDGWEEPSWKPLPAPAAGRAAVVLVHGTFARRAPWTLADSPLSRALNSKAQVVRFNWSGANSMRSRRLATLGLRACVADLAAAGFEGIALVAHSHGGNLALKACELPDTARHVQSIVCLATPFISAWRPRARLVRPGLRLGIALLMLMLVLLLPGALGMPSYFELVNRIGSPRADVNDGRLLFSYFAAGLLIGWLVARQFGKAKVSEEASEDLAGSVCDATAIAPLVDRTLIVTAGGDEADGVLKIASALNRSLVASSNWRQTRPGEVRAAVERIGGRTVFERMMEPLRAAITHMPAAIPNLAFGVDARGLGASVFFTSSETPAGVWRHWHVDGTGRPDETTIAHSSLYDDPRVIDEAIAWIAARQAR